MTTWLSNVRAQRCCNDAMMLPVAACSGSETFRSASGQTCPWRLAALNSCCTGSRDCRKHASLALPQEGQSETVHARSCNVMAGHADPALSSRRRPQPSWSCMTAQPEAGSSLTRGRLDYKVFTPCATSTLESQWWSSWRQVQWLGTRCERMSCLSCQASDIDDCFRNNACPGLLVLPFAACFKLVLPYSGLVRLLARSSRTSLPDLLWTLLHPR